MILAATGHRPNKLGGYSPSAQERLMSFALAVLSEQKPDTLISGMALGWDMAMAEAALVLQIKLIAAVPFSGQDSRWPEQSKLHYQELLKYAKELHVISPGSYAPWKMQARNEWMVDEADGMIALWDGSDGGTANCVRYAEKMQRPVLNVWPGWSEWPVTPAP